MYKYIIKFFPFSSICTLVKLEGLNNNVATYAIREGAMSWWWSCCWQCACLRIPCVWAVMVVACWYQPSEMEVKWRECLAPARGVRCGVRPPVLYLADVCSCHNIGAWSPVTRRTIGPQWHRTCRTSHAHHVPRPLDWLPRALPGETRDPGDHACDGGLDILQWRFSSLATHHEPYKL